MAVVSQTNASTTITTLTDSKLVSILKQSNEPQRIAAFEELFKRYYQKAYNLAMRITRNRDDSEEVLQDTFSSVYLKIHNFEETASFSSWLYRITSNACFMKLHSRRKHASVNIEDVPLGLQECWVQKRSDSSDLNYLTSRHELRSKLARAISVLPDEYRSIFILRDIDGYSNQEVASHLDLSIAAVKSRLHRARMTLRKALERYFKDYSSASFIDYGRKEFLQHAL